MNDPDFGLGLTHKAAKRLKQAKSYKDKTISLSEIKERYIDRRDKIYKK